MGITRPDTEPDEPRVNRGPRWQRYCVLDDTDSGFSDAGMRYVQPYRPKGLTYTDTRRAADLALDKAPHGD